MVVLVYRKVESGYGAQRYRRDTGEIVFYFFHNEKDFPQPNSTAGVFAVVNPRRDS
jgi:hypothetical protein